MTRTKHLTKAKAMQAYRKVCKKFDEQPMADYVEQGDGQWPTGPVLCKDFESWSSTTRWAIVWEGGEFEWAYDAWPVEVAGVFAEPINTFALGLYLDD